MERASLQVLEKMKNNLCERGLCVVEEENVKNGVAQKRLRVQTNQANIFGCIWEKELFEDYLNGQKNGQTIDQTIDQIAESFARSMGEIPSIDLEEILCLENVQKSIRMGIMNTQEAKTYQDLAATEFLDLSCFYFIEFDGELPCRIQMCSSHLEHLGVTKEQLHEIAQKNTRETVELVDMIPVFWDAPKMYAITANGLRYGASVLADTEVLKNVSEQLECDLVIIPSSKHEILTIPYQEEIDVDAIYDMVAEVNATELSEQDFLSNNVYFYCRETGQVIIAERNTEKR